VCAVLPLARFRQGLAMLESRRAIGRVVLEMRPAA
jgi:hypothetical protein